MADPLVDPTAAPPVSAETPATPDAPPEPSLDDLRARLAERDAEVKLYKDTLAALGSRSAGEPPSPSAASAPPPPVSEAEMVRELARETGFDESQIEPYLRVSRAVFNRLAAPAVNTLVGLADGHSRLEARLTVEDWKELESEAVKIAREYRQRGIFLDYKSAADIARARKGPELLAREAAERAERQRAREKSAAAAASPTSIDKPSSVRSTKTLTADDIKHMKREDREKAILDALGDSTF